MVDILPSNNSGPLPPLNELLYPGEVIAIVDDSPEVALLLEALLNRQQIAVVVATNGEEFFQILAQQKVALVFLDIGLPGMSGIEILNNIAPHNPDLGIIMVTGTIDAQIAVECIRRGADDYLTKPVSAEEFNHTLQQTLKKRRLAIENRLFQKELEATNFRMKFLHNLNFKMNTAYLNALELDSVLQTILAGITSDDGLRFNRAFLALYDEEGKTLNGIFGIGPSSREEAQYLWRDIKEKNLDLPKLLDNIVEEGVETDTHVNRVARSLKIDADLEDHILIQCSRQRKSVNVRDGRVEGYTIQEDLLKTLEVDNFVVVPLFSPSRSLGVIIADNFVTGEEITADDIMALEIFASEASLAIEHSHLYRDMNYKITELKQVTEELEKNKDMLVEAERYSTIGYVSAQLVHAIRNPLTSIGGTARLLLRKTEEENSRKLLQIMIDETVKIEETLTNLFHVVGEIALDKTTTNLNELVEETVAVFYPAIQKYNIILTIDLTEENIILNLDNKKIRQVFIQLLRNSIEKLRKGGQLALSLFKQDEGVQIIITDLQPDSFDHTPTTESQISYTAKTYGAGMGLALVEEILELHDAKLSLQQLSPGSMQTTVFFPF